MQDDQLQCHHNSQPLFSCMQRDGSHSCTALGWFGDGHGGEPIASTSELDASWGGLWTACTAEQFAVDAVQLYTDEQLWNECQHRALQLLRALYDKDERLAHVRVRLHIRYAGM